MFQRILIANRGEIAVRIIRACRDLCIESVVVYSEADHDAMPTRLADTAICIGPPPAAKSYLNMPAIMAAAEVSDAEAIHPGYGFLAENADFAEICIETDLAWIGPPPAAMRAMGDKVIAKNRMRAAGVPTVPGSDNAIASVDDAKQSSKDIGFPVIVKAAAGGGGRGMKIVHSEAAVISAFMMAQSEAAAAFGDDTVYIEKYLEKPRHIEVQILADRFGNVVHLFERECSMQRKNQKVLEEAPSPFLDQETRQIICRAGVTAAKAVNYVGVGTVEFLVNPDKSFYFIEMNTRIQVEHPVTEAITGIDLVEWQIRTAAGERLPFSQVDIHMRGHAIECRINAEHPYKFTPSPGTIDLYHPPGGRNVRVESAVYSGYTITPYYDSMIGKIIVQGSDRPQAIRTMQQAMDELVVSGVQTNKELHQRLLANPAFQEGRFNIHFLENWLKQMNL